MSRPIAKKVTIANDLDLWRQFFIFYPLYDRQERLEVMSQ